jgi:hypothetical protein
MAADQERWKLHRELSNGVLELDAEDLGRLLPLSPKRILLDRVVSVQPGLQAVARKAVTTGAVATPGRKCAFVFPSTTALVALEQLSMVILLSAEDPVERVDAAWRNRPTSGHAVMVEVESLEVEQEMAVPGLLDLRATRVGQTDAGTIFEGGASVGGEEFVRARWVMGAIEN